MKEFKVKFKTVDEVAQFVNICSKYEEDINFKAANYHYIVDAKSILSMISIGLNEICEVHLNTNSNDLAVNADFYWQNIDLLVCHRIALYTDISMQKGRVPENFPARLSSLRPNGLHHDYLNRLSAHLQC